MKQQIKNNLNNKGKNIKTFLLKIQVYQKIN